VSKLQSIIESRSELDSQADTCCVGIHSHIVSQTLATVKVTPFLKSFGSFDKVPIVTAAVAYDVPSGIAYILILHY
jgi:hypothetical protein